MSKKHMKQGLARSAPNKYSVSNPAPKSGKRISRRNWQELKRLAYERDKGRCMSPHDCGYKSDYSLPYEQSQADHIVPRSRGGDDTLSNIRVLCPVCHSLRAGKEHEALRKGLIKMGVLPRNVSDLLW